MVILWPIGGRFTLCFGLMMGSGLNLICPIEIPQREQKEASYLFVDKHNYSQLLCSSIMAH